MDEPVFEQSDYCQRCGRERREHVQHCDNRAPHCPALEQPLGDVHQARHAQLHAMLDELVADWILHTERRPSSSTVLDLMRWANEQRLSPTPNREYVRASESLNAPRYVMRCSQCGNHWPASGPGTGENAVMCAVCKVPAALVANTLRAGKVLVWLHGRWWRVVGGDVRSPSLIASQGFDQHGNEIGPLSGIEPPTTHETVRCEHCGRAHQGADCPITYPGAGKG